jgi:hypothetical protein
MEIVADVKKFGVTSLLCWIEALCLGGNSSEVLPLVQGVNKWLIAKVSCLLVESIHHADEVYRPLMIATLTSLNYSTK